MTLKYAARSPLLALMAIFVSASAAQAVDCNAIHQVNITFEFVPGDIYLAPGDCVRFTNIHHIEHSAIGMEREFNTGVLMPNNSAVHRFNEEIAIPYVCGVHPLMVGVLVVEEPEDDSAVQ